MELAQAVESLTAVCLVVAVIECAIGRSEACGGLHMICGAAVAWTLVSLAAHTLQGLLP